MALNSQLVSMEIGDDGIAIIRICNPPVNALTLSVIAGLREQYQEAVERNDVKAIVLTGDGKFCGGLDINIVEKVQKKGDTSILPDASVQLVIDTIENGKKPSVAAIQAFALGGGLELAMGCCARVATSRAEIGLPELKLGLIPGCGGTQRLPRLVGTSKAIEMLMSSKIITCEEGKELGIIDDVVSSEDLLTVSRLWALDIAEGQKARTNILQRTDKIEPIHESSAILEVARQKVLRTSPSMPHFKACLDVIEEGIISGGYAGVLKEDKVFRELILSKSARALLHVYFAERATSNVPGITDCNLKHRKIEKVAVIGGGLMGSGIATTLILNSIQVILKEINYDYLQKSLKSIEVNVHSVVQRGELLEEKMKKVFSLLKGVVDYEEFRNVDMVIEAVNEDVLLKQSIFEEIEKICSSHCILASNTSTIDLNVIGERTKSQDRIVGTHLFSPAHVMPLLEIIQMENTSKQVILDVLKFAKTIQKVPIVVQNCTGFAVNRTFFPYMQGAEILANLGVDIFRVDRVITDFGMRIGPFQLFDLSGYSVFLAVVKGFAAAFPDRTFQCPLVLLMVENGRTGKKDGRGYYLYKKGKSPEPDPSVLQIVKESRRLASIMPGGEPTSVTDQEIVEMMFFPVVNEASRVIEEGVVVRASDLDIASVHGMKFPSERGGIMYWADSIGAEYIYARLKSWSEAYGHFFKPSQFLEERATKGIPLADP
ncbi:peroxisomal fatty acid beta-oxidation multifunctional protein AIM1-like isoform X4 [Lycium ferocissimum]|uniref:peroxisomal fatty acid beta-oxidation multifunctional protein AIM1-like isoform X4 n=1 Tax=Lycium ferocissimum TaxID=112874 RepID=UPI002815113D|nr:peroxisomal fatty acid beta-oxidation multifunctional protein AIM1-like isoform X4 [Lycium ferocissimum]